MAFTPEQAKLALDLRSGGYIKYGQFTLSSGATSNIYVDLRPLRSDEGMLDRVVRRYQAMIDALDYRPDRVADVPIASSPVVTLLAKYTGIPQVTPREAQKDHGVPRWTEGLFASGMLVALCDDVLTTGGSLITKGMTPLRNAGLEVRDAFVLVDRCERNGKQNVQDKGVNLHADLSLPDLEELYADITLEPNPAPNS